MTCSESRGEHTVAESGGGDAWRELREAIGLLVMEAGQLEGAVRDCLLNMLPGRDWHRTRLLVERLSAGAVRESAERMAYAVLAGQLQADVLVWLNAVGSVQSSRNRVVHARWSSTAIIDGGRRVGPAAHTSRLGKPAQGVVSETRQWTPAELRDIASECARLYLAGLELVVELQDFSLAEGRTVVDLAPWSRDADQG